MSLVRLLKAGKSLTDLHSSTSRYRMRSRFLLPKFGSTKNPFTAPVPVEVIQAASEGTSAVERYQKSPAELSAARLKETAKLPETAPAATQPAAQPIAQPIAEPIAEPAVPSVVRRKWFNQPIAWMRRLNPFAAGPRLIPSAKSPASRPGRSPVQAELSLDNIRVMRNDLNDADVEIVPVKSPVKSKSEPARPKTRSASEATAVLVETQPG